MKTRMNGWLERGNSVKKVFVLGSVVICLFSLGQTAQSQEYPKQPITMLISNAPGAGTDVCSRVLAHGASKVLGQEILPVNKPGAGGAVATGILASSKPDGYTLLAFTISALTVVPHLETVSYDPLKDIVPITHFGNFDCGIMVQADSPFKTFKDMIDFARINPGKVSIGLVGIGNPPHLDIELVMAKEKVNMPVVPFGGAAPGITALLGGHITAMGAGASGWMPNWKAGKVRVLATTSAKRVVPEIPTLSEFGYPFYGISTEYYLMAAPKGTPDAIVKKLDAAFRKAVDTPEFRTTAESFFVYEPNLLSGQQMKELIENLYKKNGEVIKAAKIGK